MSLTILVPVFNEIKTIQKVIDLLKDLKIQNKEIIIVDDYSTDGSRELIKQIQLIEDPKTFKFCFHNKNLGKGSAIKSALNLATKDYFIIQDGDLEYSPSDLLRIYNYASQNKLPVVYGSRFKGEIKNMILINRIGNIVYNVALFFLYGKIITDMHTCYKLMETSLYRDLKLKSEGFEYATEIISKLLKRKVEIKEIPISFNGRSFQDGKKINHRDGFLCLWLLFKNKFNNNFK